MWVALGETSLGRRTRWRRRRGATIAPPERLRGRRGGGASSPAQFPRARFVGRPWLVAFSGALALCTLAACEPERAVRDVVRDTEAVDERGAAGTVRSGGRLVAVTALADGGNQVWAVDIESGVAQPLFTTDPSYSMSEWKVAPSGNEVAYRLSHPLKEVRERLVVQQLAVGAEPTEVAASGSDEARLAGAAWHEPGLVYGLQAGLGIEEGSKPAWSLMRWDGRRSRTMWRLDVDEVEA